VQVAGIGRDVNAPTAAAALLVTGLLYSALFGVKFASLIVKLTPVGAAPVLAVPPPLGVVHWPKPFRYVVEEAVPDDAKRATGTVPEVNCVALRLIRLEASPEAGVPKLGVIKVGEVAKTTLPLPVVDVTLNAPVPPQVVTTPLLVRFDRVDKLALTTLLASVVPVNVPAAALIVAQV
jgi:hypothetical protein